ncbi:MAG: hypothetical protein K6G79_01050, partial [Bacteroidales bacterium]|nr:hypothetical protein [Bacteroidales bacterium]
MDEFSSGYLKSSVKRLTISANVEESQPESKTTMDSNAKIYWMPGDAVSLFFGSGTAGGSKFTSTLTEPAVVTDFSGEINVITGASEAEGEEYFWALYPYDSESSCDGSTVTMRMPSVQTGQAGTFGPGCAPSLARSLGLSMSFKNVWAGFGFSVTESGFTSV